jgi:S-adenosylmethionine hydrolase
MPRPIITLTTDFGLKDPYVAEMKAVILRISPDATIVDVSHEIEKFNMKMGAYVLASAAPYFPKRTVHVAVVDPGVGTQRRPIAVQTKRSICVGPDNGILSLVAAREGTKQVREITNRKLMMLRISNTFHGRDIFAPVAAHLSKGTSPSQVGPRIENMRTPSFAKPATFRNKLVGEIIHVDDFGNIITNIPAEMMKPFAKTGRIVIRVENRKTKLRLCKVYGDLRRNEAIGIIGSHDFLEIAVNQGNASKVLSVEVGDKLEVRASGHSSSPV